MLVYNEGANGEGFAICLKCGYADSEPIKPGEVRVDLPKDFENHAPIHEEKRWKSCWRSSESPVIRKIVLAARETTDALYLDFSACRYQMDEDGELASTVGYALQQAASRLLELDTREIGVLRQQVGGFKKNWAVVLYDNVPGGAGHTRELLAMGSEWFKTALEKILVIDADHDRLCQRACLDCLLTFDSQMAYADGKLNRKNAVSYLRSLLGQ